MSDHNFEDERVRIGKGTGQLRGEIQLAAVVGSGAEGTVYHITNNDSSVVKIFNETKRADKAEKVRAMIENEPQDPTLDQLGTPSIIWPTATVVDPRTNEFLGYVMPYKDLEEAKNAQQYARDDLRWANSTDTERFKTALNLALMVRAIHKQGHAMGDYNHQNILIEDGYVSLIDCDAFHIAGADRTYPDDTYFPRYAPPEGRGDSLDEVRNADLFQLGVHIFQLLMEGFHPYQARGSAAVSGSFEDMIQGNPFPYESPIPGKLEPHVQAPDYDALPQEIRDLFSDCFDEVVGRDRKWGRPKPKDWAEALKKVSNISTTVSGDQDEGGKDGVVTDPGGWRESAISGNMAGGSSTGTQTQSSGAARGASIGTDDDDDVSDPGGWRKDAISGDTGTASSGGSGSGTGAGSGSDSGGSDDDEDERDYPDWMDE